MNLSKESQWVLDNPYRLLGLQLSMPRNFGKERQSIEANIKISDDSVNFTFPRNKHEKSAPLFINKESFLLCSLIYSLWAERCFYENKMLFSDEKEIQLYDDCLSGVWEILKNSSELRKSYNKKVDYGFGYWDKAHGLLLSHINVPNELENISFERSNQALFELEEAGLIVDPMFAGAEGAIILLGLVPMSFSNQTVQGEKVSKEINVAAALWDFKYWSQKDMENEDFKRSVSFNIRGLKFVQNLTRDIALRYLKSEGLMGNSDAPDKVKLPNDQ